MCGRATGPRQPHQQCPDRILNCHEGDAGNDRLGHAAGHLWGRENDGLLISYRGTNTPPTCHQNKVQACYPKPIRELRASVQGQP